MRKAGFAATLFGALMLPLLYAQQAPDASPLSAEKATSASACEVYGPETPDELKPHVDAQPATAAERSLFDRFSDFAERHKLRGLASYYSSFFDGRKTANGEIYRNAQFSAAHLTLPLGCWVEVRSIATGRKIRLRVNDRGPYTGGFVLDLSQAAARALGVDRAADRRVEITVLALPGEQPPPEKDETEPSQLVAAQ